MGCFPLSIMGFLPSNLHENELLDILNHFKLAAHCELTLGRVFVAGEEMKRNG